MFTYQATLRRIVDGDTGVLDVDLGFRIQHTITCRMKGYDTPERGEPGFHEANKMLEKLFTDYGGRVTITTHKTGKYGRWLVWIEFISDQMVQRYGRSQSEGNTHS